MEVFPQRCNLEEPLLLPRLEAQKQDTKANVASDYKTSNPTDVHHDLNARLAASARALGAGCGLGTPRGLLYKLARSDTLAGISLRYDVTTDALRAANFLTNDRLVSHLYLIIPVSWCEDGKLYDSVSIGEDIKRSFSVTKRESAVQALMAHSTDIGHREAEYYITSNGSDFVKALANVQDDRQWERNWDSQQAWHFPTPSSFISSLASGVRELHDNVSALVPALFAARER